MNAVNDVDTDDMISSQAELPDLNNANYELASVFVTCLMCAASSASKQYNTIQYNTMICNAHKVEYRTSNLRRGQSLGGRGCGRWLTRMRCEECFKTVFECM